MIQNNIAGPNDLLDQYKRSLEEIKEKILHYEDAFYKIMTLSEDEVNFRIFRVMSKKLKEQLGEEANKIKERILEATYNYCTDTVNDVFKTYNNM